MYNHNNSNSRKRPYVSTTPHPHYASPPLPSSWRCDACNLTFESGFALQTHVSTHTKCSECNFQGSPKAVKGHHQAVHGKFAGRGFKTITVAVPGCPVQRFSICVGNHPDDIAKWIAERRKKFPRTVSKKPESATGTTTIGTNTAPNMLVNDSNNKAGLDLLLDGYGSSDTEEGEIMDNKTDKPTTTITAITAESSTNNGADDQKLVDQNNSEAKNSNKNAAPCRDFLKYGTCRRGDHCRYSHDPALLLSMQSQQQQFKPVINIPRAPKRPATLLEKLLVNDEQRETDLTLQLLEYIYHSNFLTTRLPLEGENEE